jgi:hypothetical protein
LSRATAKNTLLLAAALMITAAPDARAEDPASPAPAWGPLAGALTATVPLMVGSVLVAQDGRGDRQRAGIYVMTTGFAAAPWVAHGVSGRWRRALGFGLVSAATSAGTIAAMSARDPFDPALANRKRLPFGLLLTSAFFAATVGIIDSFVSGPRAETTPGPGP